jgi:hypothetical protein
MTRMRLVLWSLGILLSIAVIAVISVPNLLKSRVSTRTMRSMVDLADGPENDFVAISEKLATPEKKVILNGNLALVVADVRKTSNEIKKLVESQKGEVQEMEITGSRGSSLSATIRVRVPSSTLSTNLEALKKLALWTERESVTSKDVTREFYDNEAHLRNLHAEEDQYLKIMQQAKTVKDTLEVSEKLSDVRDRIERLQTQIQLMTHDIEMSVIDIRLSEEADARVFGIEWRPLANAKMATRDLLSGITDWFDLIVAFIIKLPLILLWLFTIAVVGTFAWRIGKRVWNRFLKKPVSV